MALDLLSPDQANPFADLIAPGSGNLGITPEPQNPFADLIHPDTQATDAAHANLIGGGTADAPAYQEVGGFFRDVPRGIAVSTTDYGPFNDLVATAQPKPITNYAEQFGSFADLVPRAAPETEKQAANIRNEQITSGNPALDRILARQKELESGLGPKNWWDKLKQEFTDTISDVTDINQQKRAIIPPDRIADLLTPSYDASTATTLDQHARVAALRIGEGVSGLVTPENALIVGSLAGAPALVGRLVSAGFGLTAAKSVYDQSKQLVTQDTTPLEKTRLVTGILIDGAFTAVMGRHAIRGEPAIRGEQNAIQEPSTTSEVLRTGQARENVPSDTGRVEPINPQGTPPGAGPPETAPTEAVPPATQTAPLAPINQVKAAVDRMDNEIDHSGPPDLALDLETIDNLPEHLSKALEDYRNAVEEDRTQYGERSGLPEEYGNALEKAARDYASITANDLRPALKTDSGIIEGKKGQEHDDIYASQPNPTALRATDPQHGFVDPAGNFYSRAQGQEALGLKEPLTSQTLIELQKASEQPTKGGETVTGVPTPEAPVTPKKAADEIKTEIVAGKRDPAEIKNEIVQRVQGALDKLAEDDKVEIKQSEYDPERYGITPTNGRRSVMAEITEISPGKWQAAFKDPGESTTTKINGGSFEEITANLKSRFSEAPGTVTFHIPGDGTFKLARNGKALMDLLKRAKSMKTGEAPIKASENLIRKPAGPGAYTEAGSYAQHLYETLGKEAAITDQKAQLAQVSSKSQAAKLIKDTLSELSKYSDKSAEEPQGATVASETGVQQGTVAVNTQPLTVIPNGAIKTPKSQRQIITDIAKGLQVPIRFGRLRTSKFAGYFIPKLNLIGSKLADNIPIVSHEAGHKLDREFKMSENKAIASELNVLGDPATTGSMSSWTKSKTRKYKMGEGVAEFIRYWLTDPTHAEQVAPNTFKVFESLLDENKDMGDTLRQAQSDIHTWRTAPSQARLRSQISVGDNPNKTRYTLKQLTRDLVDDLHILRLAVADAAKGLGRPLEPSKDPYLLARNLRGSYGMAGTFVRDGVVDFNTKEVTMGSSFEDALKPVAGRIGDFRDWIVAKGAQDLMRQGKETGLVKSDVDSVVVRFDKDPAFQKALGDLQVWSANLVKYAVDSGLLTPKAGAAMLRAHQIYVPLHRVFEIGAGEAPSVEGTGTGRGLNVGKPGTLKYRSGSTRQIVDPLETWVKNAYAIITASEKAAINHAVAGLARLPDMGKWVEQVRGPKEKIQVGIDKIRDQLIDAGADPDMLPDDLMLSFYRQSKQAPFSENTIRIVDPQGNQQFFRLDRDLFDTFHALDLEDSGHLVRALSKPGQLLRSGVVLEPSFALANVMRDLFSSVVISKRGALPFEAPLRGAAALIGNHKLVAEWAAAGGESAIEINYFDRGKMQTYMKERITKDLTPFERALVVAKHPFYALRKLTAFSEEATRIGEYQLAYNALRKSGMAEGEARRLAAFESRDRQDFAKGGAKTKIPRAMTPFWNAALQGNLKLAQSFRERPTRTILQGIAWVTIPKMIEQAVNWDDKDYWDRPQWERDAFFLIPAGKDETGHTRFIRIPTPFEVGIIFGTIPGRMMQWAKTNRQEAMKNFASSFLQQTVPNPMPQVFQVVYEDFMSGKQGWDVYRGRPIVPDSLADLPPELQFTDQTSTLAKKMGEMTGMSPMKIDHIIGQTTGGMGKVLSGQQVPGKRFVTTPLRVSNQTIEDFYQKLGELKADYQRAKAGTKDVTVEELPAFNKAARRMGELRTAARVAEDEQTKAQLQEEIYQIARRMMGREEVNK